MAKCINFSIINILCNLTFVYTVENVNMEMWNAHYSNVKFRCHKIILMSNPNVINTVIYYINSG